MYKVLNKLALRNIKRSAKDYIIYLVTVTLAFALIFSFNLISNSKDILELSEMMENFKIVMYFISAIVIFVIGWLINYTTKFIFKKRSKEFGTYMLLGIPKKQISKLFLTEIIILGLIALIISFFIGFLLSILLSAIIMNIFSLPYEVKFSINSNAILLTLLYFALIYLIVLFFMKRRLKKMKIYDLLYLNKQNEKHFLKTKKSKIFIFIISLILSILAFYIFDNEFKGVGEEPSFPMLLLSILIIIITIYGFTFSISDFILNIVLKSKTLKYHNQNLFITRQFSSKVKSMSMTLGTLSMLIAITLVSVNFSLLFNGVFEYQVELESPYDITVSGSEDEIIKYKEFTEKNYDTDEYLIYDIYQDNSLQIKNKLPKDEQDNTWLSYDPIIKLSDYNTLQKMRNKDTINLKEDEYALVTIKSSNLSLNEIKNTDITLDNKKLHQKIFLPDDFTYSWISGSGYIIVVPDQITENLKPGDHKMSVNTKQETTEEFYKELIKTSNNEICTTYNGEEICYNNSNIEVRGYFVAQNKSIMTILSFSLFYLAFIFTAAAGTILAIQNLSDSAEYRFRYLVLEKLGVDQKNINKTIFKQLSLFFIFPIIYPIIINIIISHSLNNIFKDFLPTQNTYIIYIIISTSLFLIIYLIYFLATYFSFKNNIRETK